MSSTKKLTSVWAAVLAAGIAMPMTANAADLLVDPPIVEAPEVKSSGGWYLRGDITYDVYDIDRPNFSVPGGTQVDFVSADADDAFDIGVGIGYQFNDYLRADLTGEYVFSSDFTGSTAGTCGLADVGGLVQPCTSRDTSEFTVFKFLANAYVDLGKFNGITPYVGAGIGGAYVSYDSLTNSVRCGDTSVDCRTGLDFIPTGGTNSSTFSDVHSGESDLRFAWALHAGASYDISHKAKLDFGYTYSRIEDGDMFQWLDGSGTQGHDDGLDSHVFRLGLRYQIW